MTIRTIRSGINKQDAWRNRHFD